MNWYVHSCDNIQTHHFVMWFTNSVVVSLLIWMVHYLSVFLTIGAMVMTALRVLGLSGRNQSMTQVAGFYLPWMWIGLGALVVTGLMMLAGDSALFCQNGVFGINMLITALAAISGVIIQKNIPRWDRPSGAPMGAKFVAAISLLLWLGTILAAVEVPSRSDVP